MTTDTLTEPTTLDRLRAIVDHAERHQLGDTISSTSVSHSTRIHLHLPGDTGGADYLPALLRWARTLHDVTVNASYYGTAYHVTVHGRTATDNALAIVGITSPHETETLRYSDKLPAFTLADLAAFTAEEAR